MTGTICKKCDRLLLLSSFRTRVKLDSNSQPYVYRHNNCRACDYAYSKAYFQTPKGKEIARRWHSENWRTNKAVVSERKKKYYNALKQKDARLRKKYGMSIKDMEAMLAAQGGVCAVCKSPKPNTKDLWVIDHNHTTGRVRGVLCGRCNSMIGYSTEKLHILYGAIDYLISDMSFYAKPSTVTYPPQRYSLAVQ